ncbi:hypothetical protein B0H12DRAFT_1081347 [Mycena haematopus]|nr:hypothetical protein B0H12DRAFT_1081347 [Mycena haematopus]
MRAKRKDSELVGKYDLHEPHRLLANHDEYDHLSHVVRLCTSHIYRNIKKANVSETVRNLMRSLVCIEHPDWDSTIQRIRVEGGTAGANANWEGISCTLVGRIKKGLHLDSLKMKTLNNWEKTGIRPTYARGHISESTSRSLKRKSNQHHKSLAKEDARIHNQNKRLRTAHDAKIRADDNLHVLYSSAGSQAQLQRAQNAAERAADGYVKALVASREVVGSGSGKVGLLLPSSGVPAENELNVD